VKVFGLTFKTPAFLDSMQALMIGVEIGKQTYHYRSATILTCSRVAVRKATCQEKRPDLWSERLQSIAVFGWK
jgi:hypothetical protein